MKISNVVCPFCGALCDDLEVIVENNEIKSVENACKLGASKFLRVKKRIKKPLIMEKGKFLEISMEKAIEKAAEILKNSEKPLIYGFSSTSCEAQAIGVALAEVLGGAIDCTSSVCHGPSIIAVQEVGYPSLTLGEVKNRADLVIYWGSDPMHAHPRHLSRYSIFPRGRFRERGLQDRELIVVDVRETDTAKLADWFIKIKPNRDFEVFNALRTILNKGDIFQDEVSGISKQDLKKLAEKMKTCQFGILFFGLGLTMSAGKHKNIVEAISLVIDLNRFTKFSIMAMRGHYNVTGFNEVLTWQTGFPYAVDFSKGYPWYNPGETDANSLLQREEVDAALVIASDPAAHFPKASVKYLSKIPLIVINPFESVTSQIASLVIPSTIVGIEEEGSAYRMDSVPIKLRKVVNPPEGLLSDEEILRRILNKVKKVK